MHVTNARETLLDLLRAEGQKPDRLELAGTWRAFRRFMDLPVDGVEEDALLYQYITAAFDGPRRFTLSLCRQFDTNTAGEQALIQLHCELAYEPTPSLEALGKHHQWWTAGQVELQARDVLNSIRYRPEWAVLIEHHPVATAVYQERAC